MAFLEESGFKSAGPRKTFFKTEIKTPRFDFSIFAFDAAVWYI